jgi:hypothetical protein
LVGDPASEGEARNPDAAPDPNHGQLVASHHLEGFRPADAEQASDLAAVE